MHGATGAVRRKAAERLAAAKAAKAVESLTGQAVDPVSALDVLDSTLTEVVALKDRLGAMVGKLQDESARYEGRAGEQLRGEISAYMASIRDCVKTAETIVKLGLAERRVRIQEAEVLMMAEAIREILRRLDLSAQQKLVAAVEVPKVLRELEQPHDLRETAPAEPERSRRKAA